MSSLSKHGLALEALFRENALTKAVLGDNSRGSQWRWSSIDET